LRGARRLLACHTTDRAGPQLASGTCCRGRNRSPTFRLTDTTGRAFTRHDLGGGPTLVFFGFTHCPDVCPTTLMKLAQVRQRAEFKGLRVLFVSVDRAARHPGGARHVRARI